jgi:hypothetical protein
MAWHLTVEDDHDQQHVGDGELPTSIQGEHRSWKPNGSLTAPNWLLKGYVDHTRSPVPPAYAGIRPTPTHPCACLVMKGSPVRVRASALDQSPVDRALSAL